MELRSFSIRIPVELADKIEAIAKEEGRSLNNVIFDALNEGVEYYKATREAWRIAKDVIKKRIISASGSPVTIDEIKKVLATEDTLKDSNFEINQETGSG